MHQLLAKFGQTGVPPGVRDASDLPGTDEWWLPELAERLGVKAIAAHRWRWSGWLHAGRLRGTNGRWVVWANAAEVTRLRRLRAFEARHNGRRAPASVLTTPAKRNARQRVHRVEGMNGSFKYEDVYLKGYERVPELDCGLYNTERPHQSLGYRTPAEVYGVGAQTV